MTTLRKVLSVSTISAFVLVPPTRAADELCAQFKAFEAAPLAGVDGGSEDFNWIELHWPGISASPFYCMFQDVGASSSLCYYLTEHVGIELDWLLMNIALECFGVSGKPREDWSNVSLQINHPSEFDDRELRFEIDTRPGTRDYAAMRITIVPSERDPEKDLPRPLIDSAEHPLSPRDQ